MKKAFTLLELVFVIAVVGILAAIIIPNTRTNPLREAAIQLVSHIRYTQHLAMIDDKFDVTNAKWYRGMWTILFNSDAASNNLKAYTIMSDRPNALGNYNGNSNETETAKDPSVSGKVLSGGLTGSTNALDFTHPSYNGVKSLNLGSTYGITDVIFNSDCQFNGSTRVSFDHLGRPLIGKLLSYTSPYVNNRMLTQQCRITLVDFDANVSIAIEPETGYAHILP